MGAISSKTTATIAAITLWPAIALAQDGSDLVIPPDIERQYPGVVAEPDDAVATQTSGGLVLTFGISSTLKVDDNYKLALNGGQGDSFFFDNNLSFGLRSDTRTQSINFTASALARAADVPFGSVNGFDNENLRFEYTREAANAQMSFTARYLNVDRQFLDPFLLRDDEVDSTDEIFDDGTLTSYGARARLDLNTRAPIGFSFGAGFDERDYSGTTDPDLFDTSRRNASATMRMRLSPVTDGRITARWNSYEAEDIEQTDRITTRLSFGVLHELDRATTVDAEIGTSRIDTDETIGLTRINTIEEGIFGTVTVTRALPNGSAAVSVDSEHTANGQRNTLMLTRNLDLPNGFLWASLGATDSQAGGTDIVGALTYEHVLASGRLTASLSREVYTNSSDNDVLSTRLGLGYAMELSPLSGLSLSYDWLKSEDGGAGAVATTERGQFEAAYTYALTPDWDLTAGYQLRTRKEQSGADADSNAVFVTLGRSFTYRP